MRDRTSRSRATRYRESLRQRGLRPVQIWIPDTRAPGFVEQLRLKIDEINAADRADATLRWLETVSVFDDDAR